MAKKSTVILIVILVVVICAAGVFLVMNNQNGSSAPAGDNQQTTKKPTFDENAGAFQQQVIQGARGVAIPGWESMTIPAEQTNVIVDLFNPESNEGYYYMTFELKLADGESLYQSGLVRAGDHIQNIVLSRGLPKGTYDAILHVQPYTADDDLTPTNNANMRLKLIVI